MKNALFGEMERKKELEVIATFLNRLQKKYSNNSFSPANIHLSKNGNTVFATVKDADGEIILDKWELEGKHHKTY